MEILEQRIQPKNVALIKGAAWLQELCVQESS